MKSKLLILFFLLLFSISGVHAQSGINYKRSTSYGNLSLSINDLKKIVAVINYYNKESLRDTSYHTKSFTFSCDLSNNSGKSISIATFEQLNNLKLDENYTELDLDYTSYYAGLSSVKINFHGYGRDISVGGTDENKVEAVYQDINSQLESNERFLSGMDWALIILILLVIAGGFSVSALIFLIEKIKNKEGTKFTLIQLVLISIFLLVIIFCMFSPASLRNIFPRFLITPDSTSWIDRNINLMGFLGFLIGLISVGYNGFNWVSKKLALKNNEK